jgi:DNA-3-methyladenine glycosylase I
VTTDVDPGEDGLLRCTWGTAPPECRRYHDLEWGRPEGDDDRIFEMLSLEGFQAGLSWLTILRKREGFRRAFAGFSPTEVAAYDDADVERLLSDAEIVRHRGKILAVIANARATLGLRDQGTSLAELVWEHEPSRPGAPRHLAELPAATEESKALSAELRRRGFRFVGPTTVYAAMQSLGVVNDHFDRCHFRSVAEEERSRFTAPGKTELDRRQSAGKQVNRR